MNFGLLHLKAKTPLIMRSLGTAMAAASTFLAGKEFMVGKYQSSLVALVFAFGGKFLTECFGEPTTLSGTVDGIPVTVTENPQPPTPPELTIIHTPTASDSTEA